MPVAATQCRRRHPPGCSHGGVSTASLDLERLDRQRRDAHLRGAPQRRQRLQPVASTRIATGLTSTSYADTAVPRAPTTTGCSLPTGRTRVHPPARRRRSSPATRTRPRSPGGVSAPVSGTRPRSTGQASTDNVGRDGVPGAAQRRAGGPVTFSIAAPTTTLVDCRARPGTYSYEVRARDAAGNWSGYSAAARAQVVVDQDPPTVAVTAPAAARPSPGRCRCRPLRVTTSAVAGVQFRVDGVPAGAEDTSAPVLRDVVVDRCRQRAAPDHGGGPGHVRSHLHLGSVSP